MKITPEGLELIKRHEGLRLEAYRCPAGVWTIGYGHTGGVRAGDKMTSAQAERLLLADVARFEDGVTTLLQGGAQVTPSMFSALVSLAFNVGLEAFGKSRLLALVREGKNLRAGDEFERWVHAGGKRLPGLVARRAGERALFLKPDLVSAC